MVLSDVNDYSFVSFVEQSCDMFLNWYCRDAAGFTYDKGLEHLQNWELLCKMCEHFNYKTVEQLNIVISKLEIVKYNFMLIIKKYGYQASNTRKALNCCEDTLEELLNRLNTKRLEKETQE